MSSHHSTSVCSLQRPTQTSIRNFFAASVRSHRTLPFSHRKRKGGNSNPIPAADDAEERSSSSSQRTVAATPLRNHCSNENQRSSKRANVALPKKKKHQQLYLDLGQKNFAENTECEICGMLFVHGLKEDAKRHTTICQDYKRGVPFASIENARVVQKDKLARRDKNKKLLQQQIFIVEIRPSDSYALRKKVNQVKAIVEQELGFSENNDDEAKKPKRTTFLAIVEKRVVGMVQVESICKAYALLSSSCAAKHHPAALPAVSVVDTLAAGLERSNVARRAALGIHQMWVHQKFRTQGIASTLVDVARSKMVFGYTVPVHELAFSSPTESGVRFARRYNALRLQQQPMPPRPQSEGHSPSSDKNPAVDVLVYDCC